MNQVFSGKRLQLWEWCDDHGRTLILALHHAAKTVNILDAEFASEAQAVLKCVRQYDADPRALIICSRQPGSFLHGADVSLQLSFETKDDALAAIVELKGFLDAIEGLPYPTIALINSTCLGGGFELALACDYRMAAATCPAIGLPEVMLGVLPGAGGTVRLPRLIGIFAAAPLILAGKTLPATKAKVAGLVDLLCDDLTWSMDADRPPWLNMISGFWNANKFCSSLTLSDKYPSHLIESFWMSKQLFYTQALKQVDRKVKRQYPAPYVCLQSMFKSYAATYEDAMKIETESYLALHATAEAQSIMSLYASKDEIESRAVEICTDGGRFEEKPLAVFVVGSGWMGGGIGQHLAANGAQITMYDINDAALSKAKRRFELLFEKLVRDVCWCGSTSDDPRYQPRLCLRRSLMRFSGV